MIDIIDLRIIVTIGNTQDFGNNDEAHLSFEKLFLEVGYKAYWGQQKAWFIEVGEG